jgi:hypothetical protein
MSGESFDFFSFFGGLLEGAGGKGKTARGQRSGKRAWIPVLRGGQLDRGTV